MRINIKSINRQKLLMITVLCFAFALLGTSAFAALTLNATTIDSGVSSLNLGTATGKLSINNATSTAGALKIHSHQMAALTDDSPNQYANEFKGEFLATSGTMDGIAAHYHMAGSGTGVLRSILGDAYLDTGITLSGTSAAGSWISGVLGDVNVAGTVNGSAATVTGVYGGLGSMIGATLTAGKYMSGIWADSQATQVLSSGSNQLILATNSGSATMGSGLKILNVGTGAITRDIILQNGAPIDNNTAKVVAIGGTDTTDTAKAARVLITAQRTVTIPSASATGDAPENFLTVQGYITGVGTTGGCAASSTNCSANTRGISIDMSRPLGSAYNTAYADTQDNGLKIAITNKATANLTGYTVRGMDVLARTRDSGNVTYLTGGYIAATADNSPGTVGNIYGVQANVHSDGTVTGNVAALYANDDSQGSSGSMYGVLIDGNGSSPTRTASIRVKSTTGSWNYGLDMNGATLNTADIRLSNGVTISSGATNPTAACVKGSLFLNTTDGFPYSCTATTPTWTKVGAE